MKTIDVIFIHCEAGLGSSLVECLFEACALAFTEQRNVVLVHNERSFKIEPIKIVDALEPIVK